MKGNLVLFTPGALDLPNRIVMPPMSRSRAAAGDVATRAACVSRTDRQRRHPDQPARSGLSVLRAIKSGLVELEGFPGRWI